MKIKSVVSKEIDSNTLNLITPDIYRKCDNYTLYGKFKNYLFVLKKREVKAFDTIKNCFINGRKISNMVSSGYVFEFEDCSERFFFEDIGLNNYLLENNENRVDIICSYEHIKNRRGNNYNYENKSNELISNDKWEAQSEYLYGLSIIYKNDNGKELYGVVDSNYNVVFDYDTDVVKIKRLNNKLLLIESSEGISSIYDISKGYVLSGLREKIEDISMLYEDIIKIKINCKYRLFINGKLDDVEYDNLSYDRGIIIGEKNGEVLILDSNLKILYKTSDTKFSKSETSIYYKKDGSYIEYNLFNGKEEVIGKKKLVSNTSKEINYSNLKSVLSKYKYYYYDDIEEIVYLFHDKEFGIALDCSDISVIKWYKNIDEIKKAKRNILMGILELGSCFEGENDIKKRLIKE